jgi:hypothetical protein
MVVIWLDFGCVDSDCQGADSINRCEKMGMDLIHQGIIFIDELSRQTEKVETRFNPL